MNLQSFNGHQTPSLAFLQSVFNRCAEHIETRYGIEVRISDVVDPNTGDFDGSKILIDYDQDLDIALFVLIHLFGHTVQWNTSEQYRTLGLNPAPKDPTLVYEYEKEATRLSLSLLHEIGVTNLDQWASDWWAADWLYLQHIYRTGEKLNVRELLRPGAELLSPMEIPQFIPQRFVSRWSF